MKNYQKPTAEVVELLSAQEIAVNTGTVTRPTQPNPTTPNESQQEN